MTKEQRAHLESIARSPTVVRNDAVVTPAAIRAVLARIDELEAINDVRGGEWCAKNRAEGRDRCGACAWCCCQALARVESAEAKLAIAVEALRFVRDEHPWSEYSGYIGKVLARVDSGDAV